MNSLKPYATIKVRSVSSLNAEYMEITFTESVKDLLQANSVADNLTWQADLHMKKHHRTEEPGQDHADIYRRERYRGKQRLPDLYLRQYPAGR